MKYIVNVVYSCLSINMVLGKPIKYFPMIPILTQIEYTYIYISVNVSSIIIVPNNSRTSAVLELQIILSVNQAAFNGWQSVDSNGYRDWFWNHNACPEYIHKMPYIRMQSHTFYRGHRWCIVLPRRRRPGQYIHILNLWGIYIYTPYDFMRIVNHFLSFINRVHLGQIIHGVIQYLIHMTNLGL